MSLNKVTAAATAATAAATTIKMKLYYREDYDKIKKEGFTFSLPAEVMEIIKTISSQVGAPEYIKTPHFEKRTTKPRSGGGGYATQDISDAEWDNLRSFQATVLEKKKGIELSIDQIRKHLNKITDKTYDTLKLQIITEINKINAAAAENDDLKKIGDAIFMIASGNSFFSAIYAKLYKELMHDYEFLRNIFTTSFNTFSSIFKDFTYCDPNKDYDKFCQNNKTNEKRRALGLFYVNLMLHDIIPLDRIVSMIEELQSYLAESIKKEANANICEELTEVIYILVTNGSSRLSKNEEAWTNIMRRVSLISTMKVKSAPSISNKTIFKHMDLMEFVNKMTGPSKVNRK